MPIVLQGKGIDNYLARLESMAGPELPRAVGKSMVESAETIRADAVASLDDGAILGKGHIPSVSPDPPNSNTRDLANSGAVTEVIETADKVYTSVTFGGEEAPYAPAQELGAPSIGLPERPYLSPATARNRQAAVDGVREARDKVVRGN